MNTISQSKHVEHNQQVAGIADAVCKSRCIHPEDVQTGLATLLPSGEYIAVASTFQALADPTRAKIVYMLLTRELCTCDLASVAGISESAVSQHINLLRRLRLVRSRRAGKVVYHTLDDDHINTLLAVCLEHIRGL